MNNLKLVFALALTPCLFAQNGTITTVAGNGSSGISGVGGPAVSASVRGGFICVDSADNLYIADRATNRVLKVDAATGILSLVAGNGIASSTGDLGPAIQASLNAPSGMAIDAAGNLYITEFQGHRVRRIDAATGIITTVAGNGIATWAGDGGPAVQGSLNLPVSVAFDSIGNLFIADSGNYRVRRVDAMTGVLTTVVGNGINAHSPDGTPLASASLALPYAVSFDRLGNLLITEAFGYSIRSVSPTNGLLGTFAGNGGTTFNGDGELATAAALGITGSNVVADPNNNLYFADGTGRVRRVDAATGVIITVAGSGAGAHGQTSAGAGGGGTETLCSTLSSNPVNATLATLDGPAGVALTSGGKLLITDPLDCRVRAVQLPSPLRYTTTALTQSGNLLAVRVSPIGGGPLPTGNVAFGEYKSFGDPTLLAMAPLNSGSAFLDTSSLPMGSHQVLALYVGDGVYNGSGSADIAVTGAGGATPSISSYVPSPAYVGDSVPIQLLVSGNSGTPTGTVQVMEGSTPLIYQYLVNGSTNFTYQSNTPGLHTLTVQYAGDAAYRPASTTFSFRVVVPSTVMLTADQNPAYAGSNIVFTGVVSPATATGTMSFFNGPNLLGTSNVISGSASLTVSTLTPGTTMISAHYNGDDQVAPVTSNVVYETINVPPTTTTLISSGSPSVWGQPVALTATVIPSAAVGSVDFYEGSSYLGTTYLSGGAATFALPQLAPGVHSFTATYIPSGLYLLSTSPVFTQVVNKATAAVALASSLNPATSGQSVVFTASLTPATATGSVQFMDGATLLGSVPVTGSSASFSTAALTAGNHTITALYSGDTNFAPATSTALTQSVNKLPATAALSVSSATIAYGQTVNLTASVTPPSATGTVQFLDGASVLATLPVSNGIVPVVPAANLTAGIHTFTAIYSGDANTAAATSLAASVTVTKAATTLALTSSLNPANSGQAVVFTATLVPITAAGTVQFLDGASLIGTAAISGGIAQFSTANLAAGAHAITAVYAGDSNHDSATSAALSQTVNQIPTATSLSATPTSLLFGQSVNFTAVVSPAAATGIVQLLDGATLIGRASLANGSAVISLSNLTVGSHSIKAVYTGDAAYAGSTSATVTVTVAPAIPASPSNLSALAASASQINLSWTAIPTAGVTYNVYASSTSSFVPSLANRIATGLTSLTYANTGLPASTTRYYFVTAQNVSGESTPSNQAFATTASTTVACQVLYTVSAQTDAGFAAAITIQNTGSKPFNGGWQLTWTWGGNQQITQSQNANYTQTGANAALSSLNSKSLASGATLTGVGFNASYTGSNPAPAAFFLNGTRCQ